jgi:hypothetical protein
VPGSGDAKLKVKGEVDDEPTTGASHQILDHFGKAVSKKKIFGNRPI